MSRHSFDPKIASLVGVNAAVIYQNLLWWCEKNHANGANIREGRVWTYNSLPAFSRQFPYFTERQIRTALEKLQDADLIIVGEYNEERRDRTKWYSVNCSAFIASDIGVNASDQNVRASDKKVRPLPDSKPDLKPDTPKPPKGAEDPFIEGDQELLQEEPKGRKTKCLNEEFDEFWDVYPRKDQPDEALKNYKRTRKEIDSETLLRAAKLYRQRVERERTETRYIQLAKNWLSSGAWRDFSSTSHETYEFDRLNVNAQNALLDGRCPPSLAKSPKGMAEARYHLKRFGFEVPG